MVQHEDDCGGYYSEQVVDRSVYMLFYCRTVPLQNLTMRRRTLLCLARRTGNGTRVDSPIYPANIFFLSEKSGLQLGFQTRAICFIPGAHSHK
jgi:hypothetical protein